MNDGRQNEEFSVIDGDRELQFSGVRLGQSTSWATSKARWAEIEIYRTVGGQYIVAGVGRSVVDGERDKHWAQVCEFPEAVIERLHLVDRNGARYIPYVSKDAINQARVHDAEFAQAYMVERVD